MLRAAGMFEGFEGYEEYKNKIATLGFEPYFLSFHLWTKRAERMIEQGSIVVSLANLQSHGGTVYEFRSH